MSARLRLGPMLRHVSDTTATVWVETGAPGRVEVIAGEQTAWSDTFTVHGHHYALCDVTGLAPGSAVAYEVRLDGEVVWPEPSSPYPPSLLCTVDHEAPARIVFGSCHTPTDHSPSAVLHYGVDMLRAFALRLVDDRRSPGSRAAGDDGAGVQRTGGDLGGGEPDLLLMVGDQVYADELQPAMRAFVQARREEAGDGDAGPPPDEVVFYDEYAELYRQAWSDPDIRWLMSTVPTLMIFDDHDIRDDWNTSGAWQRMMAERPWWGPRVTSGLGAYWVYQHLGNLSPAARAADPVLAEIRAHGGDAAELVDAFAWRTHTRPASYRWNYRYDIGRNRIVVMDTRCSRDVADDSMRSILGGDGYAWLDEQLTGDVDHLVIASTLPFLMPMGVHYMEAWNEAVCAGAWGRLARRPAERLRQRIDLEHWPAFQRSFKAVGDSVLSVASGERGAAPATILFLGGDVHFSYLTRALPVDSEVRRLAARTRIVQLVCSPTCNWMQPTLRRLMWVSVRSVTGLVFRLIARSAGVRPPALRWAVDDGPWYDNALATVTLDGRDAEVQWEHSPIMKRTLEELGPGQAVRPKIRRLTKFRLTG
ncbi:PhoD-like phosphatase [Murinocardiopsis flavida]|uniref:PhoD-like phosphatase n=1 Tax=Murinocardiopsis flavida TaxID=645275 RepID=A0A2P8DHL4_9ACTN|nr:alkaline phosphatase D family protein [Murinocardiopsis flavida]PSK96712.1 PhoD-like phosphatase [Murinocardiopsis flavida]